MITLCVLLAGTGSAAAVDLATRRIPNLVSVTMAVAGLVLAGAGMTPVSIGSSLAGLLLGLVLMLPGYLFGATGAGDVKLFAAAGAVIGAGQIGWAFCYTAIAGGILALTWAAQGDQLRVAFRRLAAIGRRDGQPHAAGRGTGREALFPYGPAICVGSTLAVLL